jgi:predicted dehydrogenase
MQTTYNWGIIGAGRIANLFADGLKELPNANRYAIAARSSERAEAFREKHGFERAYGSYGEMLADPKVDIVYISTTNNLHFKHTMMSLEAGKAVLCEKPFASDAHQVQQMVAQAQKSQRFLMEALWSRFLPSMMQFKDEMLNGTVGRPHLLQCNFGFISPYDPQRRVYNPELGGGSIPDIGVYPLFVAMYLFGAPTDIKVISVPAPTGTDWTTSVLLQHAGKEISMLISSFEMDLVSEACLYGSDGYLKLHSMFHTPTRLSMRKNKGEETPIPISSVGNGYNYEAAEVMRCLDEGLIESPGMPLGFSIEMMQALDTIYRLARESYGRP